MTVGTHTAMSPAPGQYQDLLELTVKVFGRDQTVVGTGVIISADGLIATCAHVVTQAGWDPRTGRPIGRAKTRFRTFLRWIGRNPPEREPIHLAVQFAKDDRGGRLLPAEILPLPGCSDDIAILRLVATEVSI